MRNPSSPSDSTFASRSSCVSTNAFAFLVEVVELRRDVGEEERVLVGALGLGARPPQQVGAARDVAAVEPVVAVERVVDLESALVDRVADLPLGAVEERARSRPVGSSIPLTEIVGGIGLLIAPTSSGTTLLATVNWIAS